MSKKIEKQERQQLTTPGIVYVEAVLLDNNELIHFGRSLGFISDDQYRLVTGEGGPGACKLTRGGDPIVRIGGGVA